MIGTAVGKKEERFEGCLSVGGNKCRAKKAINLKRKCKTAA